MGYEILKEMKHLGTDKKMTLEKQPANYVMLPILKPASYRWSPSLLIDIRHASSLNGLQLAILSPIQSKRATYPHSSIQWTDCQYDSMPIQKATHLQNCQSKKPPIRILPCHDKLPISDPSIPCHSCRQAVIWIDLNLPFSQNKSPIPIPPCHLRAADIS